jgi:hypothetical protein
MIGSPYSGGFGERGVGLCPTPPPGKRAEGAFSRAIGDTICEQFKVKSDEEVMQDGLLGGMCVIVADIGAGAGHGVIDGDWEFAGGAGSVVYDDAAAV